MVEESKSRIVTIPVSLLVALLAGLFSASSAGADPRIDYMLNCRGCHGPEGAGAPGAAPSFRGQVGKFLQVPGGRAYLIQVPGTAQSELSDARTAAVLNWIVCEFSPKEIPADFVPFTKAEVASHRRAPLTDVFAVRRKLMQAIREKEKRASASKPQRSSR